MPLKYVFLSGLLTDELRSFLELNLPKVKEGKKAKFSLGVADPKIGSQIAEVTKIPCQSNEFVGELLRGVRLHFDRFMKDLKVRIFFGLFSVYTSRIPFPSSGYIFIFIHHPCFSYTFTISIARGFGKSSTWSGP